MTTVRGAVVHYCEVDHMQGEMISLRRRPKREPPRMTFDATINVTNLLAIGLAVVAFVGGWYKFGGRLDMLEFRVKTIDDTLKIMAETIKTQASNEKHLALVDQRTAHAEGLIASLVTEISDLRRGKGWIQSSDHKSGVDREY